jgi:hypothetical protein
MFEMGDMFSENGVRNPFHHEVFVMDVILNRAMCEPSATTPKRVTRRNFPQLIQIRWQWFAVSSQRTRMHRLTGSFAP